MEIWSSDTEKEEFAKEKIGGDIPKRISSGSSAEDPNEGTFYYLNGGYNYESRYGPWLEYKARNFAPESIRMMTEGMMVLDNEFQWKNESAAPEFGFRAVMEYLPLGKKGVLAMFGGGAGINNLVNLDSGSDFKKVTDDYHRRRWRK